MTLRVVITARVGDWHICPDFPERKGMWACGKTIEQAVECFKQNAESHGMETDLEIRFDDGIFTQQCLSNEVDNTDPRFIRERQRDMLAAMRGIFG